MVLSSSQARTSPWSQMARRPRTSACSSSPSRFQMGLFPQHVNHSVSFCPIYPLYICLSKWHLPTWHHQGCNDPDWPVGVFYSHELSVTRSVCGYLQPGLTVRTQADLWVSFICPSQVPPGGPVDTFVTSYFRFCHIVVPRTECLDCEPVTAIEDEQDSIYLDLFRVPLTLKQRSRKK